MGRGPCSLTGWCLVGNEGMILRRDSCIKRLVRVLALSNQSSLFTRNRACFNCTSGLCSSKAFEGIDSATTRRQLASAGFTYSQMCKAESKTLCERHPRGQLLHCLVCHLYLMHHNGAQFHPQHAGSAHLISCRKRSLVLDSYLAWSKF